MESEYLGSTLYLWPWELVNAFVKLVLGVLTAWKNAKAISGVQIEQFYACLLKRWGLPRSWELLPVLPER